MTQFRRSADPMGRYRCYLTSSSSRRCSGSFASKREFSNSETVSLRILRLRVLVCKSNFTGLFCIIFFVYLCSISSFLSMLDHYLFFSNVSISCFMLMVHIRMQLGTDISVQMQTKAMGGGSEPVSDYLLFYYYNRN